MYFSESWPFQFALKNKLVMNPICFTTNLEKLSRKIGKKPSAEEIKTIFTDLLIQSLTLAQPQTTKALTEMKEEVRLYAQ